MSRYVISLGGNALGNNAQEQHELLKGVARPIARLIKEGHEVVIVHGNGPQVGMINLAFTNYNVPDMPFPECGAMSEGYIGYDIQNALYNEFQKLGINKTILTVVSQVLVDQKDPRFLNPTKPIGKFYSKEEAEQIQKEYGYTMKEDAGRGYRRVVPSPLPIDLIEKEAVNTLINQGEVVICAGGGGIPVIKNDDGTLEGIAAVIDKDFASAKVAEIVNADYLIILTAVDNACINYKKEDEKKLEKVSVKELEQYIEQGQFAKGSMLPKIEACINFLKRKPMQKAIISSLDKAESAFKEKCGTIISMD
ncbi:MAG: carbamate kinase [Bacilli bacterium]|nr:carbamate kinase [Bacilli bacterium]